MAAGSSPTAPASPSPSRPCHSRVRRHQDCGLEASPPLIGRHAPGSSRSRLEAAPGLARGRGLAAYGATGPGRCRRTCPSGPPSRVSRPSGRRGSGGASGGSPEADGLPPLPRGAGRVQAGPRRLSPERMEVEPRDVECLQAFGELQGVESAQRPCSEILADLPTPPGLEEPEAAAPGTLPERTRRGRAGAGTIRADASVPRDPRPRRKP